MGWGQFTEAELEELKRNPYVHDVNRKKTLQKQIGETRNSNIDK